MTDEIDYPWCIKCHGPFIPMAWWERWLSWACYWLALHWPHRLFVNKAHMAILPWAGNIAFRCTCRAALTNTQTEPERDVLDDADDDDLQAWLESR